MQAKLTRRCALQVAPGSSADQVWAKHGVQAHEQLRAATMAVVRLQPSFGTDFVASVALWQLLLRSSLASAHHQALAEAIRPARPWHAGMRTALELALCAPS